MPLRRITIQDVADACGLSRNTVSKVFNNRGTVQEPTRQLVMKKAQELGYFQLVNDETVQTEPKVRNIALLTRRIPSDFHFGTFLIPAFAAQLGRAGYTLMVYEISEEELLHGRLPAQINLEQIAAILCIELFDRSYIDRISEIDMPILLVDGPCGAAMSQMNCDIISMENLASTMALVKHVIGNGARSIGFVGDPNHCNSFHERWISFYTALANAELPLEKQLCILDRDDSPYSNSEWLADRIRQMPSIPDALICANDYLAIHVMAALKQLGLSVPEQVMVAGFDGSAQSALVEPALTTVKIAGSEIGRIAADLVLKRIVDRSRSPISVYVKSVPIYRESTNRKEFVSG